MQYQVHKFGGSSLADAQGFRRVASILQDHQKQHMLAVVSAAGHTTNLLYQIFQADIRDPLGSLRTYQMDLARSLLSEPAALGLWLRLFECDLTDLTLFLQGKAGHIKHKNDVLALGEVWAARLLTAYLTQIKSSAQMLDAREILVVEPNACPTILIEPSTQRIQRYLATCQTHQITVMTGFICVDQQGRTQLLGRNGSDFSATLMASLVDAEQVTIWTDVAGIFDADPRQIKQANLLSSLTFREADTLAKLGCSALHERSLMPLKGRSINLCVRSSFVPKADFTEVGYHSQPAKNPIVTSLPQVVLFQIHLVGALDTLLAQLASQFLLPLGVWQHYQGCVELAFTKEHQLDVADCLVNGLQKIEITAYSMTEDYGLVAMVSQQAHLYRTTFANLLHRAAKPIFATNHALITLVPTPSVIQLTQNIHRACTQPRKTLGLVLFGWNQTSQQWLQDLPILQQTLSDQHHIQLCLIGVANERNLLLQSQPLAVSALDKLIEQGCLWHDANWIQQMIQCEYDELVVLDTLPNAGLIPWYPSLLAQGIHVISTHNSIGSTPLPMLRHIQQTLQQRRVYWQYATSLSPICSIPGLLQSWQLDQKADFQIRVRGSGVSLPETSIEEVAEQVMPDNMWDELTGISVARTLVILAREIGFELDLHDIHIDAQLLASLPPVYDRCSTKVRNWLEQYPSTICLGLLTQHQGHLSGRVLWQALPAHDSFYGLQASEQAFEFTFAADIAPVSVKGDATTEQTLQRAWRAELHQLCNKFKLV
ncbi:MAG: hypothetical protein ISP86_03980 [Shewanellaceae bacterium]|nr:hypothetical protein [Shewanellaceae bacterium]